MKIRLNVKSNCKRCVKFLFLLLIVAAWQVPARAQNNGDTSDQMVGDQLQQLNATDVSADQLMAMGQQNPQLMAQMKKVAVAQMKQQGEAVPQGGLSDQELATRLQDDPDFKEKLVNTLKAQRADDNSDQNDNQGEQADSTQGANSQNSNGAQSGQTNTQSGQPTPPANRNTREGNAPAGDQNNNRVSTRRRTNQTAVVPPIDPNSPVSTRRKNPYADLQALKDLYLQLPMQNAPVNRFGMDVFRNASVNPTQQPTDLPAGPEYILGIGDGITIDIWGGVSQHLPQTIDRQGKVSLPEAGSVVLAGKSLADAQRIILAALKPQFRNIQVDVSLARVRSVRVYVVGEVAKPGAYDISSLSTPLNALYAAGGPTERGSLRRVRHFRGERLVHEVDLYDMLVRGVRSDVERIESGDTIMVPPVGPQVTVVGMVRRPAMYELRDEKELGDVIDLAGGLLVSATLDHISIERIQAHQQRLMLNLELPNTSSVEDLRKSLGSFGVQDGDKVTVFPILPYSNASIYVEGHVFRPGKYPFHPGMKIGEIVRSYNDVLPEPAKHAEIIRLQPPDFRPTTIAFDLTEVLDNKESIELQPFDTVRLFGRYEIDPPKVAVYGEVLRPGEYPLPTGMTAAALVRRAGGFKRSALKTTADVSSYVVENGQKILTTQTTIEISKALEGDASADVVLKPGDIVTVRQLTAWNDIGAAIRFEGEVRYPGTYGIQEGERLSSVLQRAGGLRDTAYPAGAVLQRVEVRKLEEKSRQELIHKVELAGANAGTATSSAGEQAVMLQTMMQQQQAVLVALRNQPVTGRMVINISQDISQWKDTPNDIEVRPGDVLIIPKHPNFVLVSGQVYNSTAITHLPGKTAEWYLRAAGGATPLANKGDIFIVRANGGVVSKGGSGFWKHDVLNTRLQPGDALIVPEKIIGGSAVWRNLLATANFLSSVAITARVVTSF